MPPSDSRHKSSPYFDEIEELLNSNEEPSANAAQEARIILKEPLQELEDLDVQIEHLQQRLIDFKGKRARTQEVATQYGSILSPMRQIPSEILQEIFFHCLSDHRNPIISASEAPVLLTHICSKWRAIVHRSPRMWSRIHIPFSDDDILPDISQAFPRSRRSTSSMTNILPLRCQIVDEWLSRSGACPLSISLHYSIQMFPERPPFGESEITTRLFSILARFSHRWQNISLDMPNDVCHKLESMVTTSDLSMLETYTAIFSPQSHEFLRHTTLGLLKARNIKRFSISATPGTWDFTDISLKLDHLTSFTCNTSLSVQEAITVLKNSPGLIHFTINLNVVGDDIVPSVHTPPVLCRETISLPSLQSAAIYDMVQPAVLLGNIYECIDAPQLHTFTYSAIHDANQPHSSFSISNLLQRSTVLGKLTLIIQASDVAAPHIRHLLHSASNISHLVLGSEKRKRDGSLRRQSGFPLFSISFHNWSFDKVISARETHNNPEPEPQTLSTAPSTPTLLPRLEVLEASDRTAPYISDEALRSFILSRLSSSSNETAWLKQVTALFDRQKEKDIVSDIHRQANLIGRTIKLELDYFGDEQQIRRRSPTFGLDEEDNPIHWQVWPPR